MPWETPSLEEVREQSRDYVTAHLHSGAMVPNSVLRVLSDATSGLAYLTLLYIDWLAKQFLPDTAEGEWLARHAEIWLKQGPKAATYASGIVTVTGINGSPLPAGSEIITNNVTYETTGQITVGDVPTPVAIRALDAGAAGNLDAGAVINFVSAVPGVDGNATVVSLTGGADAETDDELRVRVLDRIRKSPMGGDADDYVAWAEAVPGVTRAWCGALEQGIGTVTVRFMCDDLRAGNQGGFPLDEDVDAVRTYLDTMRPVTVRDFFVVAPLKYEIEFTISALERDEEDVRAAIEASVAAMLRDRAEPGGTVFRSWIDEAISQAVGEDHHELTFETTPMPSKGHLPVLGTIIFR